MKKVLLIVVTSFIFALAFGYFYFNKNSFIITGYVAKKMCGCHFHSGRTLVDIENTDLANFPLNLAQSQISENGVFPKVTATLFGHWSSTVLYDKLRGCVLISKKSEPLKTQPPSKLKQQAGPFVEGITAEFNKSALAKVFDFAFKEEHDTRALLIIHKDTIVGEKYGYGFNANIPQLGWSMNKSISNALAAILVKQGRLKLTQDHLFPEWSDERDKITVNDLLQMQSGLDWEEIYDKDEDATQLLFNAYSCSDFAINKNLEASPGTYWEYSSGTSNIISHLIRDKVGTTDELYWNFVRTELMEKIGMNSLVIDTDQNGNQILSSYGYATPRDWAKFGRLYLNDGVWNNEKIFPEGWVEYTHTPATHSEGKYGAQFWLNKNYVQFKYAPEELYYCSGFEGQYVFIIPSKDLVIVRMGLKSHPDFNVDKLFELINQSYKF